MNRRAFAALLLLLPTMVASQAIGDVGTAQSFVNDARQELTNNRYEDAFKKLELAESELEGLSEAEKAPVIKEIREVREQVTARKLKQDKFRYGDQLDRLMRNAENAMGDPAFWQRNEIEINELFNDPDAKAALGDDLAQAQAKFAAFKKMHAKKAAIKLSETASTEMTSLANQWKDWKPKLADANLPTDERRSIQYELGKLLESSKAAVAALPADDTKAKEYNATLAEIDAVVAQSTLAGDAKDFASRMADRINDDKSQWEGWQSEPAGPTWADYSAKDTTADLTYFNAPKAAKLLEAANDYLSDWEKNEQYVKVAGNPQVKTIVDQLKADRDAAKAQLMKRAIVVLEQAEKAELNEDAMINSGRLKQNIRIALDDSAESKPLQDRAEALSTKYFANKQSKSKEFDEVNKKLVEQAAAAWPAMKAKYDIATNFDPAKHKDFQGKTIVIVTDNLMGYNFREGDFPFATTLNGRPIAARYSPEVAAAVEDVQKKVNHRLSQYDGKWEIIATVDGTTGTLMARKQTEGDVRVDGNRVGTVKTESFEAVEAPIITIVAAHCGPLAVASGQGTVKENGEVGAVAGSLATPSSRPGMGMKILGLLVAITASALCLVKSKFAPLASVPQVGQITTQVGESNLSFIGLACAGFGVIWLLMSLMSFAILPMLASLALIVAGLCAGLDFLVSRGVVKPEQIANLKPLVVPIGIACAVLALVALI